MPESTRDVVIGHLTNLCADICVVAYVAAYLIVSEVYSRVLAKKR